MPIIEVNHVTKEYQLGQLQSLRQAGLNVLNRLRGQQVQPRKPFKALDDIGFSIEQGEVVGIIGHNGAGKSTILKLLANISTPTSGSIHVKFTLYFRFGNAKDCAVEVDIFASSEF